MYDTLKRKFETNKKNEKKYEKLFRFYFLNS